MSASGLAALRPSSSAMSSSHALHRLRWSTLPVAVRASPASLSRCQLSTYNHIRFHSHHFHLSAVDPSPRRYHSSTGTQRASTSQAATPSRLSPVLWLTVLAAAGASVWWSQSSVRSEAPPRALNGQSALSRQVNRAAALGDVAALRRLLKDNPAPDTANLPHPSGWTPLHAAAANGHVEALRVLLEYGADVDARDKYSVNRRNLSNELLRSRSEFQSAINPRISCLGWTPLHYAVAFQHLPAVDELLSHGADVAARNADGDEALGCIDWEYVDGGQDVRQRLEGKFAAERERRAVEQRRREKEERIRNPLEVKLRQSMVGQLMPIYSVSSAIRRRENGWFDASKPLVFLFLGSSGVGKCFARGTLLRLFNGDTIAVEDVRGGMELMGDDGQRRIVTPGSLVHHVPGVVDRTEGSDDDEEQVEGNAEEQLYRITPTWEGAQPFTVNGAHILVLTNNVKPALNPRVDSGWWRLQQYEVNTDNRMVLSSETFCSQAAGQRALNAALAAWQPLEWEVSVVDYLAASGKARANCELIACKAITFTNPQLPSLHDVLTTALGRPPTAAQLDYMAWWLGIWLSDGLSAAPTISQGGAPPPDPHHHHQIFARLHDYAQVFNQPVAQVLDQRSSAGWNVYFFRYGPGSVAERVLRAYGLVNNKHIPRALICDSVDVRRRLLAGLLDGDGYVSRSDVYELEAKQRRVIVGYKELAATLGLRCSAVHPHTCTNQQTGAQYNGHRINISGHMWDVAQFCVATYKQCPQPGAPGYVQKNKDSRCYGFRVTALGDGEYFGFAVHGGINRRFLLADYTITHNTMLAKTLAKELHPNDQDNGFIRIDMTEFASKHEMARLIGSPPGYVGHEDGGQLTTKLTKCPDAVVLLDEVEKAHPDVLTLMLQVFDEGRLTDGKGNTIQCPNAIFIMTSNLVQDEIRQAIRDGQYQLRPDMADISSGNGSNDSRLASEQQLQAARSRLLNVRGVGGMATDSAASEANNSSEKQQQQRQGLEQQVTKATPAVGNAAAGEATVAMPNTVETIVPAPTTADVDPVSISVVAKSTDDFLRYAIHPILKRHFRREEFLGRINDIVVFHPLLDKDLTETVETELGRWRVKAFERHRIVLKWSERLVEALKSGYDERYGYRSMIYTVEKRVVNLLATAHERDLIGEGSVVELDVSSEQTDGGEAGKQQSTHQTIVIKSVTQQDEASRQAGDGDKKRWFGLF